MASDAQIEANKRNAQRSTGPRTKKGKAKVSGNALKHGRYAVTLIPAMPHEDTREASERISRYIDDWQPRNDAELNLVCQAARLSLAIERAERMEIAHIAERLQTAAREQTQAIHPRRLEEIQELGRRLLYVAAPHEINAAGSALWKDDPRLLVAKLEATADGCRWLLDRWEEYRHLLKCKTHWELPLLLRFIRLQGKVVDEAVFDQGLNAIFLAWDVIIPKFAKHYWERFRTTPAQPAAAWVHELRWREIAHRPEDKEEAWKVLSEIVEHQTKRLNVLLQRNTIMEPAEFDVWTNRAALDLSPEFERHRRYLSAKTREFHRTLEALRKMRGEKLATERWPVAKVDERERADELPAADQMAEDPPVADEMANGECQIADGKPQAGDEGSNSIERAHAEPAAEDLGNEFRHPSDDAEASPENFQNKANSKSTQILKAHNVVSRNGSHENLEQTQFTGARKSTTAVAQGGQVHGLRMRAVGTTPLPPAGPGAAGGQLALDQDESLSIPDFPAHTPGSSSSSPSAAGLA